MPYFCYVMVVYDTKSVQPVKKQMNNGLSGSVHANTVARLDTSRHKITPGNSTDIFTMGMYCVCCYMLNENIGQV